MQYKMMVMISIIKLTFVLPVPVTEFKQIVATDIKRMAKPTIRSTGIPSSRNAAFSLKRERISLKT